GNVTPQWQARNPIMAHKGSVNAANQRFFLEDAAHPYVQSKPFHWIRGYQVGGKSLMWARMTQRWGEMDFAANAKDGHGVDWPIRYKDLAPWYSHVEKFAGISGSKEGLPQLPDGEFLPPMEFTCMEAHVKKIVEKKFKGRNVINPRCANLTQHHKGRGPCQFRNRCNRGCPFTGYFSSNGASLPAAATTGKLTLRPESVVHSIIYDKESGKAKGVRVIDAETKETTEYFSRIVFLNAGTLNSLLILMNSTSDRFPNGLGNDHDVLGRYIMDHNYRAKVSGTFTGLQDKYHFGGRPAGAYVPRFRNVGSDKQSFLRGYCYGFRGLRSSSNVNKDTPPIGAGLKLAMSEPGVWNVGLSGMGEHLPYYDNRMTLSKREVDPWGIPQVKVDCTYRENEEEMIKDIHASGIEMLEAVGCENIKTRNTQQPPGQAIHEMGGAPMGRDAKTSMLNFRNQLHSVSNVFVSDGACMNSSACQNPSLTYMALTARAANLAVGELKKGNL
ncbi:MAG: GMC family oxidoreductase, partial [Opitutales bacterium]|nr:GMC family oxidoreductase [Opitutales bacterium]